MSEASSFNLTAGTKAERKLMLTCVNTATVASPSWEILGVGIEDSAIEFNFEENTLTDILGKTSTTVNKPQRRQTFDPFTLDGDSAFQVKLYNIIRSENWAALSNMDMLIVHMYVGATGSYEAERFSGSAIVPQSLGGSGTLDMPFEVIFGGTHSLGTAAVAAGVVTFTPVQAAG